MKNKMLATVAFWLSVVSLILAGIVSVTQFTIWLAGTQWILISIVLIAYALFLGGCCNCEVKKE